MPREISVANRSAHLALDEPGTEALFQFLDTLDAYALAPGDISIAFMDDAEHDKLHDDFLDDPATTDVITFPGDEDMDFAGEIAVNVQQAWRMRENSAAEPTTASIDREQLHFTRELSLYLVHGWLHLCGCDDKTDEARSAMRNAEAHAMAACAAAEKLPRFGYSSEASVE